MSIFVRCSTSHLRSVFTSYTARSGHHRTKKKEWLLSSRPSPLPDFCRLLCWLCLCKCTTCVMLHAGLWRPRPPGNFPLRISEQTFLSTSRYLSPHSKFSFWNSWLTLVLKDCALQSVLEKWLRIPSLLQRQEVWPPNVLERWLKQHSHLIHEVSWWSCEVTHTRKLKSHGLIS